MTAERLAADAGLPEPLADAVLQTVQRARLWRSEKLDVADELVGHFRDGLDAGRSAEALLESFGDPKQAARLIRRAVKRKRPLAWRIWRRSWQGVGAVVGLMVVVYLYAAVRLFTGAPVIARDYLAELTSAARAVPQEERAWPLYREALMALRDIPKTMNRSARPGDEGWEEASAFVALHAEALERVRAASRRAGLGFVAGGELDRELWPRIGVPSPLHQDAGLIAVLLPQLSELRLLVQLLAIDALRAAAAGDGALARADVEAMIAMARHSREMPLTIAELVSLAQLEAATETLALILDGSSEVLSDDDLRALARRLSAVDFSVSLDGEKLLFRDLVQRIYTDDGKGDGRPTATGLRTQSTASALAGLQVPAGPLSPAISLAMASRREMTREFERVFARLEAEYAKPLWEQDLEGLAVMSEALRAPAAQLRYPLLGVATRGLVGLGIRPQLAAMGRDAIQVAIALELHRRRAGDWPQALDELVPALLPAVPPDRYDGRPLRYRLVEGRPLVYSVGPDGADGDLALWPR